MDGILRVCETEETLLLCLTVLPLKKTHSIFKYDAHLLVNTIYML